MEFDLAQTDTLLTTTREVRKRLDFERPVEPEVVLDCLRIATQAPTGSNSQQWRWMLVADEAKKNAIADIYRRIGNEYVTGRRDELKKSGEQRQLARVLDSAVYLLENLEKAPLFVIPCHMGRPEPGANQAGFWGSIFPAVQAFKFALRSRGLGSCLTTFHLGAEREVAGLLGIPDEVTQCGLLPVAYTKGTDFKQAKRRPVEEITYWDQWKSVDIA